MNTVAARSIIREPRIRTVLGLLPREEVGYCQCHEHLFIAKGQSERISSALRIDDYRLTTNELILYKNHGGSTIVDAQPLGCGRMADNLVKASQDTFVNIVASTGFHKRVFYPGNHWIHGVDRDTFTNYLVDEIKFGMYVDGDDNLPVQKTSAKAGIIKTALGGPRMTEEDKELFIAAAQAFSVTGVPIMCHTEMGEGGLEILGILNDHGVPPESIIICHADRRTDNFEYQYELINTGIFLEYDTIGRFKYHSDKEEADLITRMIEKGFGDQIILGLDTTRERMKSYGGTIGLDYIIREFIPLLIEHGLSDEHIRSLTIKNPAKALSAALGSI